jgi:NADH-quinone oxidoreductase subunit L
MFLAIGSGAYVAAVFHMITHAFFKALLFLGSGSVIHGMGGEQDMRRMGGLRKLMPVTALTFIVGWLAIAGVPPFAGFWSKDEILLYAFEENPALWFVGLVTALITAYYMTRQVILVFFGEARWREADGDHEPVHPHESPWLMTLPLGVLAVLSMVGGAQNLPFTDSMHRLEHWLEPVLEGNEAHLTVTGGVQALLAAVAVVAALVGIALGVRVYLQKRTAPVEPEILAEGWYYDAAITSFMGGPGEQAFEGVAAFDRRIIDGAVNGVAASVRGGGKGLRVLQTGYVRSYALGVAVGVVALLAYFLSRAAI